MHNTHIAIIVESSHGHLISVLGLAIGLIRRGYRVSFAASAKFSAGIRAIGAKPFTYTPSMSKMILFTEAIQPDGSYVIDRDDPSYQRWRVLYEAEMQDNRSQLESLYQDDKPALVIYDCITIQFAKKLAAQWGASSLEHSPMLISGASNYDENLVVVSLPRFFQPNADQLDRRFQFIGFIPDGRKEFFDHPWEHSGRSEKVILVSATTGLLPRIDFFQTIIQALADAPSRVVLSVGRHLDPSTLGTLPDNFEVNQTAPNHEILEHARLFIGQGGQGSVLEAMYHGVPALICPPTLPNSPFEPVALRVAELGLGMHLRRSTELEELRTAVDFLINKDHGIMDRLNRIRKMMRDEASGGADRAAVLIERHLAACRT